MLTDVHTQALCLGENCLLFLTLFKSNPTPTGPLMDKLPQGHKICPAHRLLRDDLEVSSVDQVGHCGQTRATGQARRAVGGESALHVLGTSIGCGVAGARLAGVPCHAGGGANTGLPLQSTQQQLKKGDVCMLERCLRWVALMCLWRQQHWSAPAEHTTFAGQGKRAGWRGTSV